MGGINMTMGFEKASTFYMGIRFSRAAKKVSLLD